MVFAPAVPTGREWPTEWGESLQLEVLEHLLALAGEPVLGDAATVAILDELRELVEVLAFEQLLVERNHLLVEAAVVIEQEAALLVLAFLDDQHRLAVVVRKLTVDD